MASTTKSTFIVEVDGIALPPETVARINSALQKAALTEIASIDLRGNDLVFRPIMAGMVANRTEASIGGGTTGGVQIQIAPARQQPL